MAINILKRGMEDAQAKGGGKAGGRRKGDALRKNEHYASTVSFFCGTVTTSSSELRILRRWNQMRERGRTLQAMTFGCASTFFASKPMTSSPSRQVARLRAT